MQKFNQGRGVPGMENVRPINVGNSAAQARQPRIPTRGCPFGLDCRLCKISILIEGKTECSIVVMAKEMYKKGLDIITERKV